MNGLQNWEEINEKWRIFAISVNKEVIVISDCSLFCELLSPNAADLGLIPGLGRSPGEGKGYPLQYSMDCIVHGVTNSWTRLSNFPSLAPSMSGAYLKTLTLSDFRLPVHTPQPSGMFSLQPCPSHDGPVTPVLQDPAQTLPAPQSHP